MKVCKDCNKAMERIAFPKHGGRVCKLCLNARSRAKHLLKDDSGKTYMQRYRKTNAGKLNRANYNRKLKLEVLTHYSDGTSPACVCCNEAEEKFLAIDHIIPASQVKLTSPRAGRALYRWLRMNDFPPGFRVLCHNCNFGRAINGGVCPHEEQRNVKAA